MVMGVNYNYCGVHFTIYTTIESLCYIPETNYVICKLFLNLKKEMSVHRRMEL